MKLTQTSAALAALSIVSCLVAYVTKGAIPQELSLIATTSVGGYLGLTVPQPKHTV